MPGRFVRRASLRSGGVLLPGRVVRNADRHRLHGARRHSLDAGSPQHLDSVHSVADGLAPPMAGVHTFQVVRQFVDDVVLVSDDQIIRAMGRILLSAKLLTEPSGAAATAALLNDRIPIDSDDVVVSVLSGGNVGPADIARFAGSWTEG